MLRSFRLAIIPLLFFSVACNATDLTENAIKNGDFFLGTSSWYTRYWQKAKIDYLVTEDIKASTVKAGTGYQLVVPVNNTNQSVRIMSVPFKVSKGETFKCEIVIRVEGNPRNIGLHVLNAENDYKANKTVGNKFETIELNGKFSTTGNDYYRLELNTDGAPATLFIKSAKLLQKAKPFPRRTGDFLFAARSVKPLSLYEKGDDVVYEVNASSQIGRPAKIDWTVTDLHGKNVADGKVGLSGGITTKHISLGKLPLGWYSVSFVGDSKDGNPPELHSFSVLPRLSERNHIDPEKSFFGAHTEITSDGLLAAKLMGFKWIRLHSPLITKWNAVEENKGVFTYNDKAISELKRQGFGIVGTLDRTALWASTGKNDPKTKSSNYYGAYSYLPEDWTAWEKYVASVVTHYKNDIRYWQIWNEPDIPFLVSPEETSNASAYDVIVRKTAPVVRLNNPKAKLLGGVAYLRPTISGPGRQLDFLEEMRKLKTDKNLDVFTFHHYIGNRENVNKLKDDFDFARSFFHDSISRFWITELGIDCTGSNKYEFLNTKKCTSPLEAASMAVKFNVMLLSKGAEKVFCYNLFFDTNGLGEFRPDVNVMWDSKEPRPLVAVYSIMTWLLDGTNFVSYQFRNNIHEYTFKKGLTKLGVVWADKNEPIYYVDKENHTFMSLDGNRITHAAKHQVGIEPVYILN